MAERRRLGVLLTHPVQYYGPLFRRLAAEPQFDLSVYFAHRPTAREQGVGFGVAFEWDTDLLSGFESRFLVNVAAEPSAANFKGCDTPQIADIIAAGRFDAFLVMGWHAKSYWQAMRACWTTGTPVLVRGDSQLGGSERSVRGLIRRVTHRRFIPRFAACLAVGVRSEEYFRYYGARRVIRSPHFVDNELFSTGAAEADRDEVRRRWGVRDGAMVVGFVGKLAPKKRPVDILEATAASGRSDVHVVFVGDGALRDECRVAADRLAVRATFVGFYNQSELPAAYASMDVLALPSDGRETWGLVVNEAMACGRPVLVSKAAGCAPDLVIEGRTGYSFPLADIQRFGALVDLMGGNPATRARLGADASAHVGGYTAQAAARGVLEAMDIAMWEGAA